MDIAFSLVKELELDKWIVDIDTNPVSEGYDRGLLVIYFENDYWNWEFALDEDPDLDNGYFGIRNLNSNDNTYKCKNSSYFILELSKANIYRDNILFLLNCSSFDEFFNKKFSYLEEFENMLKRHFTIKVPLPLRKSDIWISDWENNYRIEVYKDGKEVCLILPLENKLYFYRFGKLFGDKKLEGGTLFKDLCLEFSVNERNIYEFYYKKPESINFNNVSEETSIEVLNVQKSYPNIDKNIFKKIVTELNFQYILEKINSLNY